MFGPHVAFRLPVLGRSFPHHSPVFVSPCQREKERKEKGQEFRGRLHCQGAAHLERMFLDMHAVTLLL